MISQAGFTAIDDLVHGLRRRPPAAGRARTGPKARGHRVNGGPPGSRTRSALDRPHRAGELAALGGKLMRVLHRRRSQRDPRVRVHQERLKMQFPGVPARPGMLVR